MLILMPICEILLYVMSNENYIFDRSVSALDITTMGDNRGAAILFSDGIIRFFIIFHYNYYILLTLLHCTTLPYPILDIDFN
jgi:hypothetical protein